MAKKIKITDARISREARVLIRQLPIHQQDIGKKIAIMQFTDGVKCTQGMCAGIADLDPETITEYGVSHFSEYSVPG